MDIPTKGPEPEEVIKDLQQELRESRHHNEEWRKKTYQLEGQLKEAGRRVELYERIIEKFMDLSD